MINEQQTGKPNFRGFGMRAGNLVSVPREFFEIVVREESSVVIAFIAAVIDQTAGGGWWTATYEDICNAAGIRSRASALKAIRSAVSEGYVIRRHSHADGLLQYRLREINEPIDNPQGDDHD